MNLKEIGYVIIFVGLLVGITTAVLKVKDDAYISMVIDRNNGSCFLEDGTCLHAPENVLPFLGGGFLSATLIVFGAYMIYTSRIKKKSKTDASQFEEKDLPKYQHLKDLDRDETIVYDRVIEAEGTIFQSELVEKTGFSKVKVTRLLDKLEGKGIIERKRRGMTNVVILNHKR